MKAIRNASYVVAMFVALLASVAQPVAAGKGAGKAVPFKGTGVAIPSIVEPGPPVVVTNRLAGQSTHLGAWTGTSRAVASVVNGVLHAEGHQTIQAADGSTLTLFITGDFPSGFSGPVANGAYTVVGGTGRFAGATGSGVFTGGAVGSDGVRPIGYSGTIVLS